MSEKFTSGPWAFEKNKVRCEVKMPGAAIALPHSDEANARLIAAAPEMFKELERLSALFRKNAIYLDEREKIENILRKARGESEVSE